LLARDRAQKNLGRRVRRENGYICHESLQMPAIIPRPPRRAARDRGACIRNGAARLLHFFGTPLHMSERSRVATRAE
jgi:hypothetical protein